jgi:hypothetical protein
MSVRAVLARRRGDARSAIAMLAMLGRNLLSRRSVVAPGGPVVSLTSYSRRIDLVFFGLESIGRGRLRPSRLILWLDEADRIAAPPATLRRLMKRGLEVLPTENLLSHKKYYPYVASSAAHRAPFVTADDDTIYPVGWLESLVDAHRADPAVVVAHRGKRIVLDGDGIAPYATWADADPRGHSPRTFAVGVGGVLYPPSVADALRDAGRAFETAAPRADDLWLHRTTLRSGTVAIVTGAYAHDDFVPVRGGGSVAGLWESNVDGGGNDAQIASTYEACDVDVLRSESMSDQ